MVGGVSIVHVGGMTETEMREKKDRVDDALHATKAALEEGIVPGGGAALLYARKRINWDCSKCTESFKIGQKIVFNAIMKPFEQILVNAGYSPTEAQMLAHKLIDGDNNWMGYNIKTNQIINMKEAGIIDPAKVTRTALENAAAVAGTLLLTECVVVPHPDRKDPQPDQMYGM